MRCRIQRTCTVVERDKASERLLASGDERMEHLIAFRETLLEFQDPANGKRDMKHKNRGRRDKSSGCAQPVECRKRFQPRMNPDGHGSEYGKSTKVHAIH